MAKALIGICGPAQAGKTTLARELASWLGGRALAFADPLKAEVRDFCIKNYGLDPFDEKDKIALRPLLVFHGAQKRREDPLYWVKKLRPRWLQADLPCVVQDCRYLNEIRQIEADGGVWVRVESGRKPANAEEERSFGEIERALHDRLIGNPIVINNHFDWRFFAEAEGLAKELALKYDLTCPTG